MEDQQHFTGDAYRQEQMITKPEQVPHEGEQQGISPFVLGILAVLGLLLGMGPNIILSLVLGIVGLFQANASLKKHDNSYAKTGKVLSTIAVIVAGLAVAAGIVAMVSGIGHGFGMYRMMNNTVVMPRMTMQRFWY